MPDLGKYADTVLSAYGISIFLIVVLLIVTLRRARQIKADLKKLEADQHKD